MSVAIATGGMFLPCRSVTTNSGGAIMYQRQEDEPEKPRMIIKVTSLESVDKEKGPLKIILKCSNNLGD